jgi:NADPH:quinone reductase
VKALRVERLTGDLSGVALADVPAPELGDGEVLVRVRAASLNYPDLLMTRGGYQFKPELPFTAGMELAGEVAGGQAHPAAGAVHQHRLTGA